MKHPDCKTHHEDCRKELMEQSMIHSIGQLFTFSMVDFHIVTLNSGFGRLGAWLSGKGAIYELDLGAASSCDPDKPTPLERSAIVWAGV
ncbi:hypothetical protein HYH02_011458 [Chlamydomonas schloesseri]|uniref:Uncharacterized protein n=1 Tax=Chlamydomonas schloesseri TaxID=2026947 RepID=A0A835T4T4_9CHLO|nr:hypothetical protein HYH02_011458 [Chlamydomonas schloesseri]|eukprot:KAG2437027.1 hypothetical protein HYH02_011458 [Chlamydomonas schloesseri]